MEIRAGRTPGKVFVNCSKCGAWFEMSDYRDDPDIGRFWEFFIDISRVCEDCQPPPPKADDIEERLTMSGFPSLYTHHKDTGRLFSEAPVPCAAEWFWEHRMENLLVTGVSGSGKTTTACFTALRLMRQARGFTVRYMTLGRLASKWRDARTGTNPGGDAALLAQTLDHSVCILDECAMSPMSEATKQLVKEILEAVNSGQAKARVWMMGNFTRETFEEMLADPVAERRRFRENFTSVLLKQGRCEIATIK